jgi:hypothetical protein
MGPLLFLALWIISGVVCLWIAKKRHIRTNFWWELAFACVGPLIIPFLLMAGGRKSSDTA